MPRGKKGSQTGKRAATAKQASEEIAAKKTKTEIETTNGSSPAPENPLLPRKVQYVTIHTTDTMKCKQFYGDVFGFKQGSEFGDIWVEMKAPQLNDKDATTLSFHKIEAEKSDVAPGTIRMGIFVKDLTKYHELLTKRDDVKVVIAPMKESWGGYKAEYQGPDGSQFSVVEYDEAHIAAEKAATTTGATATTTTATPSTEDKSSSGHGLCHLDIPVENQERAKKFYTDVFGWTFTSWKDYYTLFSSNNKKYPLAGGIYTEKETSKRISLPTTYIAVPDINSHLKKIKDNGGEVTKERSPIGEIGFFANWKDTEGNAFSLWEMK